MRDARCPTMPVRLTRAPFRNRPPSSPADASARTRNVAPSDPVMEKVRSLLVDLDAEPSTVPLTRARRPSFGSPTAPALRAIAGGERPGPDDGDAAARRAQLHLAIRVGEGAADLEQRAARRRRDAVRQPDRDPAGCIGDREERGCAEPAGLGDDHAAHEHRRADRAETCGRDGDRRRCAGRGRRGSRGRSRGRRRRAGRCRWRRPDGRRGSDGRRRGRRRSGRGRGGWRRRRGDLELASERGVEAEPLEAGP